MLGQPTREEREMRSRIFVMSRRKDGKLKVQYAFGSGVRITKIITPEQLEAERERYAVYGA